MSTRKQAHPVHSAARSNMEYNFYQAFPTKHLKPGVSLRMIGALLLITMIAAFGCMILGVALAGLGR